MGPPSQLILVPGTGETVCSNEIKLPTAVVLASTLHLIELFPRNGRQSVSMCPTGIGLELLAKSELVPSNQSSPTRMPRARLSPPRKETADEHTKAPRRSCCECPSGCRQQSGATSASCRRFGPDASAQVLAATSAEVALTSKNKDDEKDWFHHVEGGRPGRFGKTRRRKDSREGPLLRVATIAARSARRSSYGLIA